MWTIFVHQQGKMFEMNSSIAGLNSDLVLAPGSGTQKETLLAQVLVSVAKLFEFIAKSLGIHPAAGSLAQPRQVPTSASRKLSSQATCAGLYCLPERAGQGTQLVADSPATRI